MKQNFKWQSKIYDTSCGFKLERAVTYFYETKEEALEAGQRLKARKYGKNSLWHLVEAIYKP